MRNKGLITIAVLVASAVATPLWNHVEAAPQSSAAMSDIPGTLLAARRHRRIVRRARPQTTPAAVVPQKRPVRWVYMAKRMRAPKSHKWQGRWNMLGNEGWELVAVSENMFIFKRPTGYMADPVSSTMSAADSMNAAPMKSVTPRGSTKYAPKSGKVYESSPGSWSGPKSRY
ncbi:MAG: hypothetical protein HYV02_03710 [Deltaproteobacteria bacterium]|nr:hypothetical protein [Deltaproteobacteria bacterium]